MATNVFDEDFKNRLLAFQRDHGLALDGKLDTTVWSKLTEVAVPTAELTPEPAPEVTPESDVDDVDDDLSDALVPEDYPLLTKIADMCQDEAGAQRFLLEEAGLDLDELARQVESVMAEEAKA